MNISNIPAMCMYNILSYLTPKPCLLKEIKEFLPKRELIKIFNDRLNIVYACNDNYSIYENINMNMNFIIAYYLTDKIWKTCKSQWEYENIIEIDTLMHSSVASFHPYNVIIDFLNRLTYNNIKELLFYFDKNIIRRWVRMYKIKRDNNASPPPQYDWMYEDKDRVLKKNYSKLISDVMIEI